MTTRPMTARFTCLLRLSMLLPALSMASVAEAQGRPRDATTGYEAPVNRPLLIAGGVLFFGAYVPSLVYAKSSSYNGETDIKYPLVGPWLDLKNRRCSTDPCDAKHLSGGLLIADGLVQGAGVLSMVAGLFISETRMRRFLMPGGVRVSAARVGQAAYGLDASGLF